MTHNPIFQEIEADLERQRVEALWKRYGGWVVAAAVLVIVATAAYTGWHSWRAEREQKATSALIGILGNDVADSKKIEDLESFASENRGETAAVFARLHAAEISADSGDLAKAIGIYNEIAGNAKADPAIRQLADLYAVKAQLDTGNPAELQQRLRPLLADNAPWRHTAKELSAFLALKKGDKEMARQLFTELSQDAGVPSSLAARAADMTRYVNE
ncbi:MAG: tetratricopeptide repeat protein [Bdellovibrionales bacterium]